MQFIMEDKIMGFSFQEGRKLLYCPPYGAAVTSQEIYMHEWILKLIIVYIFFGQSRNFYATNFNLLCYCICVNQNY